MKLQELLLKTWHTGYSSETRVNCPVHGKRWRAYFLMPKPSSGVVAQYVCAHCVDALEGCGKVDKA